MLPYTGSSTYCYANSLHMALRGAGFPADSLPPPGQLECLTTMPFGFMALRLGDEVMFFPSNPEMEPDAGLTRALDCLGWTCEESHGGTPEEALSRLRDGLNSGPVLIGPVDMGGLTYIPWHADAAGSDHFVVALGMEGDAVRIHDPGGWPGALIPANELIEAWKAEKIGYGRKLMMRCRFRPAAARSYPEAVQQALPAIRRGLTASFDRGVAVGGAAALSLVIDELRAGRDPGGLAHFALPLGARRCLDGALLLREAGLDAAAQLMEQIAGLYGSAQHPAAHRQWDQVATRFDAICEAAQRFSEVL